jgi:hypothetical protein
MGQHVKANQVACATGDSWSKNNTQFDGELRQLQERQSYWRDPGFDILATHNRYIESLRIRQIDIEVISYSGIE